MGQITWEEVKELASEQIDQRSLGKEYMDRLRFEIREIEKQGATTVWVNYHLDGKKFASNPNMLLFPWLLGMVDEDPITSRTEPQLLTVRASEVRKFRDKYGHPPSDFVKDPDMPDIDLDCLPEARDPIKEYALKKYGMGVDDGYGTVCSVGTWQTYKFKSAMIDTHQATAENEEEKKRRRAEIIELTKDLPDDVDELKDGGKSVCKGRIVDDQDEEKECGYSHGAVRCPQCGSEDTEGPTIGKLIQEHDTLKEFAKKHKDTILYAVNLVGRVRNMGMHAGALIIADRPLYGNIPMAKSSSKGYWVSMWSEGRNTQLSKFGYIKWDILGLKTLKYIYECCRLIEQNRGILFGEPRKCYKITLKDGTTHLFRPGETIDTDKGPIPVEELYRMKF